MLGDKSLIEINSPPKSVLKLNTFFYLKKQKHFWSSTLKSFQNLKREKPHYFAEVTKKKSSKSFRVKVPPCLKTYSPKVEKRYPIAFLFVVWKDRGSLDRISVDRKSLFSVDWKFYFHLIKFFETFHLIEWLKPNLTWPNLT